jgi:AraC-like DNA-binding protein
METGKLITFADRPSDSPFVERVWRSQSDRAGVFLSIATCHCVMVVTHLEGRISMTVRGPETKAMMANCPPQGEWFGVLLKLGTFLPLMGAEALCDRNGVTLPNATGHSFWLNGSALDFPNFENMETFVNVLARRGLIKRDRIAEGAIRGELQSVTTRTEQRRVRQVTGLTGGAIHQIERARRAAVLLRQGTSILDVVHRAGYYDQAHLTRSVQRFIGQSPTRIARGKEQLSFLYNKEPE